MRPVAIRFVLGVLGVACAAPGPAGPAPVADRKADPETIGLTAYVAGTEVVQGKDLPVVMEITNRSALALTVSDLLSADRTFEGLKPDRPVQPAAVPTTMPNGRALGLGPTISLIYPADVELHGFVLHRFFHPTSYACAPGQTVFVKASVPSAFLQAGTCRMVVTLGGFPLTGPSNDQRATCYARSQSIALRIVTPPTR